MPVRVTAPPAIVEELTPLTFMELSVNDDPMIVKDLVKVLFHPENYVFYDEIISLIKELGVYGQYKSEIRKASLEAMKEHVSKSEVWGK